MKLIATFFLGITCLLTNLNAQEVSKNICASDNCISFQVGSGTGCNWMCEHCAETLGTNNYYFTDGVCKYTSDGCIGNPQLGVTYTCCAGGTTKISNNITIYLDNENNSPENNPPGFNLWVGGQYKGDPAGIKVDKTETHLAYTISEDTTQLQTWYYNYGWYSGQNLNGPWTNGELVNLPPISHYKTIIFFNLN